MGAERTGLEPVQNFNGMTMAELTVTVTCPACAAQSITTMPTDACQHFVRMSSMQNGD